MVAPRWHARANRVGLNRVVKYIAPWLPGFGVVVHRGRNSGREFRTPVNLFRRRGGFVLALTYGSHADWVRNVVAAGGCEVITRRRRYRVTDPQLFLDEDRSEMPAVPPVRYILAAARVSDFLYLRIVQ
ncbi:nitroreductase [Mycobacterium sp. IS-1742]|uniref:nitroreductase family deazaflavin-dependent oxidoreductase n=1 Tax=Mycobacterium sp. IS-1742 TaxID=1772285 RepID=UPI000740023A|nr:nitroreductase family deazaflavin-dependent oxidoreductase [Mycobacterium sp. IS-1742]KUI28734.1 nitroreductase [Mycobacterium sp. IS-1742]